jgi:hypothetical protein
MAAQTYANHRHNPKLTGIGFLFVLIAIVACVLAALDVKEVLMIEVSFTALICAVIVLLLISRAYTTRLQDRIIKLEMKVRTSQLLSAPQQAALSRLSTPQIVALRFASDEELPALLDRAERERLTRDQIKRAITNWRPDLDRT